MPRGVYPRTQQIKDAVGAARRARSHDTGWCQVDGCDKPSAYKRANICEVHYGRRRRTGSTDFTHPSSRRAATPKYGTAHSRTRYDRGPAKTHTCIDCGKQAAHWSFDWRRVPPTEWLWEQVNGTWLAYTGNPADYDPRCCSCARRYDGGFARAGWIHATKTNREIRSR